MSGIGNFIAHDMDEANTVNSVLRYRILDQTPKLPQDGLFLIQTYSGLLQLARQALRKRDAPQYNLTVEAADKGERVWLPAGLALGPLSWAGPASPRRACPRRMLTCDAGRLVQLTAQATFPCWSRSPKKQVPKGTNCASPSPAWSEGSSTLPLPTAGSGETWGSKRCVLRGGKGRSGEGFWKGGFALGLEGYGTCGS